MGNGEATRCTSDAGDGGVDGLVLPDWLTRPRPNGSPGLRETAQSLRTWLAQHGVPYDSQSFPLRAYYNEALGVWLMAAAMALFAAVVLRCGWAALIASVLSVGVGAAEVLLDWPLVTRVGTVTGENIVVHFPAGDVCGRREVVLSAHYDTKTEALDHARRRLFTANLAPAMGVCLATGFGSCAETVWGMPGGGLTGPFHLVLVAAAGLVLAFALGMGLNLASGRLLSRQSTGAVDDGGACVVLLELCRRLATGSVALRTTAVTVAFFCGEEVTMQGSQAYVRGRKWPAPTVSVNLECLGQDGEYFLWDTDGTVLHRLPTDSDINAALEAAVVSVTGRVPARLPLLDSDTYSFLRRGVPASGLGSLDVRLGATGLHGGLDRPERVHGVRLAEAVAILERLLRDVDTAG